jgi:cleavage stimulation factor subunit 2
MGMGMNPGMGMGRPPAPGGGGQGGINMSMLPPGQDLPGGQKATDAISKTLASIPPGKLEEVLTGMKVSLSWCG